MTKIIVQGQELVNQAERLGAQNTQDVWRDYLWLYRESLHEETLVQGDLVAWNNTNKRFERTQLASADSSVVITPSSGTPDKLDLSVNVTELLVSYLTSARNIGRGAGPYTFDPSANLASLKSTNGLAAAVTATNAREWIYLVQLVMISGSGATSYGAVYCSIHPTGTSRWDPGPNVWITDAAGNGGLVMFQSGNIIADDLNMAQITTRNASATWTLVQNAITAEMAIDLIGARYVD